MLNAQRQIGDCPHRCVLPQVTRCKWLKERWPVPIAAEVDEGICSACCRECMPTNERMNSVVASLIVQRGGDWLQAAAAGDASIPLVQLLVETAIEEIPLIITDTQEPTPPLATGPAKQRSLADLRDLLGFPIGLDQPQASRLETKRLSWAVGITTSPRDQPTIKETIQSTNIAGWENVHLFVDGDVHEDLYNCSDRLASVTTRHPSVGGWSNFGLMLLELYWQQDAECYLLLQDDALLARYGPLRSYLDEVMVSLGCDALVSLYSSGLNQHPQAGWYYRNDHLQYGAVAFAMSREVLHRWVTTTANLRPVDNDPQYGIDGRFGQWAYDNGLKIWYPYPSLVWHTGVTSAMWETAAAYGLRQAGQFLETY